MPTSILRIFRIVRDYKARFVISQVGMLVAAVFFAGAFFLAAVFFFGLKWAYTPSACLRVTVNGPFGPSSTTISVAMTAHAS